MHPKKSTTTKTVRVERILTVAAAIATILSLFVALFALIPAFGQWLFPLPTSTPAFADAILHFRIVSWSATEMTVEVDYIYDPVHGERVYVGGCPTKSEDPIGCSYTPTLVPTIGEGTAILKLGLHGITEPVTTEELHFFLWEYKKEPFVERAFPYKRDWEP